MNLEKKKSLLGSGGKIRATDNYVVPIEKLNLPLEPGSVVRVFCEGCGTIFGLNEKDARRLYELLNKVPRKLESFSGYYFHVGSCLFCDGCRAYIRIEPIPQGKEVE